MPRSCGSVCTVSEELESQLVRVQVSNQTEVLAPQAIKRVTEGIFDNWHTSRDICKRLSVSEYQLSRVTASLMIKVDDALVDLGLNMKSNSKKLYTPGLVKYINVSCFSNFVIESRRPTLVMVFFPPAANAIRTRVEEVRNGNSAKKLLTSSSRTDFPSHGSSCLLAWRCQGEKSLPLENFSRI